MIVLGLAVGLAMPGYSSGSRVHLAETLGKFSIAGQSRLVQYHKQPSGQHFDSQDGLAIPVGLLSCVSCGYYLFNNKEYFLKVEGEHKHTEKKAICRLIP